MKTKLLLMLLAVGLMAGAAQANMLKNPSFEEGVFKEKNIPDDWSISWSSWTSAWTWLSDDGAHWGTKHIKLQVYSTGSTAWLGQEVTGVIENTDYAFSVWAKNPTADGDAETWGYIDWLNSTGGSVLGEWMYEDHGISDDWDNIDFWAWRDEEWKPFFTAPEGAVAAMFYLIGYEEDIVNGINGIYYDDVYMGLPCPRNPSPYDGALVLIGDVELSWTNLDPNDPAGSVYVDVFFGTEPNEMEPLPLVPASGQDVSSVTVEGLAIGTYYWQVNSYLYGDPATTSYDTNPGDPNVVKGHLWSFTTTDDLPVESVDAGVDMISWSGEPVDLDATVVDHGESELTYLWTNDSIFGISVDFSNPAIEDPTVTLTKDFSVIPIVNAGFETPVFADGGWNYYYDDQSWGYYNVSSVGIWNVTADEYTDEAPEGQNVGFVDLEIPEEGGFAQVLTETLQPNTTYTLMVEVGNFKKYDWGGYKVQLLAGGTQASDGEVTGGNLLAQDNDSLNISPDTFKTSTVTHTSGGVSDPNIGLPLQIRLLIPTNEPTGWNHADFDNVRLTANPPRPVSDSVSTVELTLKVNDEANPTYVLKDTMTIDVYDTPCYAAIGAGLTADNPGDLDEDCDTDLDDLVAAVETWLNDTGLVEAVVIPAGAVSALDNSGFETPDQGDSGYTDPYPPTGVDGWTFTGGSGLSGPNGPWRCDSTSPDPLGDQFAYLQGAATISQDMTGLAIGYTYELSFFESYRTAYESGNDLTVILDEGLPSENTIYYNPGVTNTTWEARTTDIFYASKTSYTLTFRTTNPLGGDRSTIIDGVVVNKSTDLTDPYPANGTTVSAGDVELSWTNLVANDPNDSVWIDVYFDTVSPPLTQYVFAGENTTSVTVSAPVIGGTYYWQVNSYLDGSPTGDPNEGPVWVFYASDLPPYVNVDDMITWSGEPVQLAPTVEDDELSDPLSYSWSAEPDDGVVFSATNVEAPTVTITKAPGDAATFTLTLEVDDSVNPPVEDTMTIDVYDNNCLAAKAADLADIDPTDFDADCDTDIEDFAEMAETWLYDYTLTEPVEKP